MSNWAQKKIGRFEILFKMASGGMATLYLARLAGPAEFQKMVIIKRIHDHLMEWPDFIRMFLDEARIAALIDHPNVATIFDMGEVDDSLYIAMEYVHGHSWHEVMGAARRQEDPLHWTYGVRVIADAAAGLHAAHELRRPGGQQMGVVHRDVSLQNILISYDGTVKVVDFGVAYAAEKIADTAAGTVKGKAAYMSPEQMSGQTVDRRSDIFSLGVVLWESICEKRLFEAPTEIETLKLVDELEIPPPRSIRSEIPIELERIVLKALERKPEDRHTTALELKGELESLLVVEGQVTGQAQLAELMSELFQWRRETRDKRIATAMELEFPPESELEPGSISALTELEVAPTKFSRGRNRLLVAVVAALAVFGMGWGVIATFFPGDSKRRSGPRGTRPAIMAAVGANKKPEPMPATRPKAQGNVKLKVVIGPEQAKDVVIFFRGVKHRGRVLEISVARSDTPETIVVQAPRFEARHLVVKADADRYVLVSLIPVAKKARRAMRRSSPRPRLRHRPRPRRRPVLQWKD